MKKQNTIAGTTPMLFEASLATIEDIGLNGAIFLQQLHYWIGKYRTKRRNYHDGHYWIYNTYEDWQKQFPFWSVRTIQRILNDLEKNELILSANYNKKKFDKTKWYTINYDNQMLENSTLVEEPSCQYDEYDVPF